MKRLRTTLSAPISLALGLFLLGTASQSASAACQLNSPDGQTKRVINIVFDNVHLRRDNPNVPSDLEQMPNLLNFLQNNGTVSGNHHTPLISHTAHDIVTALTGVYGDRSGIPVANSYGFFKPDGIRILLGQLFPAQPARDPFEEHAAQPGDAWTDVGQAEQV